MNSRKTIFLLLVVGCLVAYVVLVDSKRPSTRESSAAKFRVVDFDRDEIDRIVLTNNDERIELAKKQGSWFLTAPLQDRADSSLAYTLLDAVLDLRPVAVLNEEKNEVDTKSFGVNKSSMRLQLLGKGAPPELLLGKNAAVEGQVYLGLANSNRVYVVAADLKNLVSKKTDDFRDRSLIDLQPAQVARLSIQNGEGEIELKRENAHWQIERPIRARANDALIATLVGQILKLQAKGFVAEKDQARLGEPFGTVSLFPESDEAPARLSLIEAPDLPDKVYAKLSTRNSPVILDKIVAGLFKAKPNDLRDKSLLRLNLDMVDRIRIEPAGKPKMLLARQQEDWLLDSKRVDAKMMSSLLKYLLGQKVVSFVADTASDLEKYGLKTPALRIVFSSYSSENTPESNAGERQITALLIGRVENGAVYAKVEEEPFVVSIDKSILERLPDPSNWVK
jgi:hypothetical protein